MKSIRSRTAAALVAGFLPLFLLSGYVLYSTTKRGLNERDHSALRAKTFAIASAVGFEHEDVEGNDHAAGDEHDETRPYYVEVVAQSGLAVEFTRSERPSYFEVLDANDNVLVKSESLGDGELPRSLAGLSDGVPTTLPDGRPGLAMCVALAPNAELIEEAHGDSRIQALIAGGLRALVAVDVQDSEAALASLRTALIVVAFLMLASGSVLMWFLLRHGLAPLARMAEDVQQIDGSNLHRRFDTGPLPSELAPIRDRMNDLLARLEANFERESRFNSAIAHELRTPISELRTMTEVALRWPDPTDSGRVLRDVLASTKRMQTLVSALLVMRRVESGREVLETEVVTLEPLLSVALERRSSTARERSLALKLSSPAELAIDTQPELFAMLVDNWLANAVEYAPTGTAVDVVAKSDDRSFVLTLSNDAPDIGANDVENLFEPFWRKDAARTNGSHSGLGLTLTASIADVLGFRIATVVDDAHRLHMSLSGPLNRA